jgi:hypothetical protein
MEHIVYLIFYITEKLNLFHNSNLIFINNEGEFVLANSEKFINKWGKRRQKGKAKFILNNGLLFAVTYWVVLSLLVVIEKTEFSQVTKYLPIFIVVFITYIITLPIGWGKNERKYNQLLGNK